MNRKIVELHTPTTAIPNNRSKTAVTGVTAPALERRGQAGLDCQAGSCTIPPPIIREASRKYRGETTFRRKPRQPTRAGQRREPRGFCAPVFLEKKASAGSVWSHRSCHGAGPSFPRSPRRTIPSCPDALTPTLPPASHRQARQHLVDVFDTPPFDVAFLSSTRRSRNGSCV